MAQAGLELLGRGLYSPSEGSRLTRVPIRRINRWTRGYWFVHRGKRQWSEPIVGEGASRIADAPFLDFTDLIEVRCLSALRDLRISWSAIRLASLRGKNVLGTAHPFSSDRFRVVGHSILAEITDEAGDRQLLDLVHDQWVFEQMVSERLRKGLHYTDKDAPQWWTPLENRSVIVHPARAFGAPVVMPGGIRTRVLAGSFSAERSYDAVARWYNVSSEAVRDAVDFEESIRRAA